MNDSLACPACRRAMSRQTLARKVHGHIESDACFGCQCLWFDDFESVQLAADGVLTLFRLIHEHRDLPRQALPARLFCPRCEEAMIVTQDRVKSGLFNYWRCPQRHGRAISFGQFMLEKGFVRQLGKLEVGDLAARIGRVQCSGCGAPVDIRHDSACPHCRAPIAVLDADAVEKALAGYLRPAPPSAPVLDPRLAAQAALYAAAERTRQSRAPLALAQADVADLLLGAIDTLWQRLAP